MRTIRDIHPVDAQPPGQTRDPALPILTPASTLAASDRAIEKLCEELKATAALFPGTNLHPGLKLGSTQIPRSQVL